jgi:hypothetical protein
MHWKWQRFRAKAGLFRGKNLFWDVDDQLEDGTESEAALPSHAIRSEVLLISVEASTS